MQMEGHCPTPRGSRAACWGIGSREVVIDSLIAASRIKRFRSTENVAAGAGYGFDYDVFLFAACRVAEEKLTIFVVAHNDSAMDGDAI